RSRWNGPVHGFGDAIGRGGGRSYARAARHFGRETHRATSLAHVLWLVYRHRVLFSRSREPSTEISAGNRAPATTIPRVTARRSAFVLGCPAVVTADLLGCPNS